ncbi:major facilitator superfamily-domain-containing protein [Infundibulicybe gibba]|nr:major facilitator superfamily-domain-containing protein [Infundibulicybe gibba]
MPTLLESQEDDTVSRSTAAGERAPLLGSSGNARRRKPFYRARPLWLVPFAVTAAIARGMTLAPRVEVFTQLSCSRLHGDHHYNHTTIDLTSSSFYYSLDPLGPHLHSSNVTLVTLRQPHVEDEDDPRRLPSAQCLGDPAVQAGAARLQTIMTTTMGLLSALTTGWWGHFGERHGRTRVLATATFGLFLTDLTFILVSTPNSVMSSHGHKLLLIAPVIEGLLGGWSTLQSATSAYISDCTSSGSRAHIFSRFTGVFYLGFSVGPTIGGWLIRNPGLFNRQPGGNTSGAPTVTAVFWVAVFCSFMNFILVLFVFPESLNKERQARAAVEYSKTSSTKGKARAHDDENVSNEHVEHPDAPREGIIQSFLSPLAIFLPVTVMDGTRKRTDWSLTLLAAALFGYMLSTGIYQLKYLYAEHVYGWGAEQLSYYISFIGGARAVFLLFLLPTIIATFKPKVPQPKKMKKVQQSKSASKASTSTVSAATVPTEDSKPGSTKAHLANEISFDLMLTRCSFIIDIISNTFVTLAPAPTIYKAHSLYTPATQGNQQRPMNFQQSQALFVLSTTLSSLGSGVVPAVQSLALCIIQMRSLGSPATGSTGSGASLEGGTGRLFGALAVLQAVGQMILGPMLFGLIYSGTVAQFPKAIFTTAAGILFCALILVLLVRSPTTRRPTKIAGKGKKKIRSWDSGSEVERGRSRVSKDLRRGYMASEERAEATLPPMAGPSGS